jgi:hypothetical protein
LGVGGEVRAGKAFFFISFKTLALNNWLIRCLELLLPVKIGGYLPAFELLNPVGIIDSYTASHVKY